MISLICEKYNIINYTVNDDGSIDVNGNVNLSYEHLTELPLIFNINDDGSIDDVNGNVYLSVEKLTELPLRFNKVTGYFDCTKNNLTTLKGSHIWVGGYFYCSENSLTNLEFSPEYVGRTFYCGVNKNLTSLIGSPKIVGWEFNCNSCDIKDPTGCPEKIGHLFSCSGNILEYIFDRVDQNFLHAFNFYKIIKDDTVNLKRLKYVMGLYDKNISLYQIKKYYKVI